MAGGHRRISNALFRACIDGKQTLTRVEALLWLDDTVHHRGQLPPTREVVVRCGVSRSTAKRLMRDYIEYREDLKIPQAYTVPWTSDEPLREPFGNPDVSHLRTTHRRDPDPEPEPEPEKKEKESAASPRRSRAKRAPLALTDPPSELSLEQRKKLVRDLLEDRPGLTVESVSRAERAVFDWARSNGKRKRDWLATVRNALRDGWALHESQPRCGGVDDDWVQRMERKYQ